MPLFKHFTVLILLKCVSGDFLAIESLVRFFRAAPSASTPLIVSSVARPPRGNIATASLLRPPPPPTRSLRSIHCRLLHAASARTSPPPMSPQPYPRQRTKVSILAKKATAFATAMARLLAQGTLLGSSPPTALIRSIGQCGLCCISPVAWLLQSPNMLHCKLESS